MIKYSFLFVVLMIQLVLNAQDWCGTSYYNKQIEEAHPENAIQAEKIKERLRNRVPNTKDGAIIVIPVVVHILHQDGTENISDAQVHDAIKMLNEDYRRENSDTIYTRDIFKPVAGKSYFEFRLAQLDPSGNPTNGITRTYTDLTIDADDNAKYESMWPTNQYFNIWVVKTIANWDPNSIILGYAQFPWWGIDETYGVIIRSDRMGRIGTGTGDRTLTHEAGHCLGLYHTFEGCGWDCSQSGDEVCDTPPSENSTQSCNLEQNQCDTDLNGPSPFSSDMVDQVENFMSYDDCQNMFSKEQVSRMEFAAAGVFELTELSSETNLVNTGVNNLTLANFSSDKRQVCANQLVTFFDLSTYGATTWSWEFEGGTPATSTLKNPHITYENSGVYKVKLTASNASTTVSKEETYIHVNNEIGDYLPISEGFEIDPYISNRIFSFDNPKRWLRTGSAGASGTSSIMVNNFPVASENNVSEFYSNTYDLSPYSSVSINFKVAFAQQDAANSDKLIFYVSGTCGETWVIRWSKAGDNLKSVEPQTSAFTPSQTSEWKEYTISSLPYSFLNENFQFKFRFESDGGNNVFIDDININGVFKTTPVLEFPEDQSEMELADSYTINWKALDSTVTYEYEIDASLGFNSSFYQTGQKTFISIDPNQSDTEAEISGLTKDFTYYWRVRSLFPNSTSDWSEVWSFNVVELGPSSSIENLSKDFGFSVYPNPNSGRFQIEINALHKNTSFECKMYSVTGALILSEITKNNSLTIQKELEKGVYLLSVKNSETEETQVQRVVVY